MNKIILIILSLFIPPLAVFLKTNSAKDTIINVVLCLLFWIPGVIHALWVTLKQCQPGPTGRRSMRIRRDEKMAPQGRSVTGAGGHLLTL